MARNLAKKYRPSRWDEVIGQDRAIAAIQANLAQQQAPPILLCGASGTGKTTLARLIGAADICEADNAPCGECETCLSIRDGKTTIGFSEINGAKFDTPAHAKQMAAFIDEPAIWRWVTFIDEVHAMSKGASDVLLKPIEDPLQDRRIVLATTDPAKVNRTLASRCIVIPVHRLRPPDLYRLLTGVATIEGIRYQTRALDMIATAADGSAREALQLLDAVATHGDVTSTSTAEQLSLGTAGLVVRYLAAVLKADAAEQDQTIFEWQAEPGYITKVIRDMLLFIYNMDAAATRIDDVVNPAFFEITDEDRAGLATALRAHARRRRRPFADFMLDCLEQWVFAHDMITDRSSLMIKVRRFDRLINGDEPPPSFEERAVATSKEQGKSRRRSAASRQGMGSAKSGFLSLKHLEGLYNMATFLPQHHGVLLNTRIDVAQPRGLVGDKKIPALVSSLTHSLALRTKDWSGSAAHWAYVNSCEEEQVRTRIALHLPAAALAHVRPWLDRWMAGQREGQEDVVFELDAQSPDRAVGYNRNRIQRHWSTFRWLVGAVDPAAAHWPNPDATGARELVVDLLKIGTEIRYSLGELGHLNAVGSSRSLAPSRRARAASEKMAFLSALADCAWAQLQDGWELAEFEDRLKERAQRAEALERVILEFPPGNTVLEREQHDAASRRLKDSWPDDPRLRPRSWRGWW